MIHSLTSDRECVKFPKLQVCVFSKVFFFLLYVRRNYGQFKITGPLPLTFKVKVLMLLLYPCIAEYSITMMVMLTKECHTCADIRFGTAAVIFRILESTKLHDSKIYTYNSII